MPLLDILLIKSIFDRGRNPNKHTPRSVKYSLRQERTQAKSVKLFVNAEDCSPCDEPNFSTESLRLLLCQLKRVVQTTFRLSLISPWWLKNKTRFGSKAKQDEGIFPSDEPQPGRIHFLD